MYLIKVTLFILAIAFSVLVGCTPKEPKEIYLYTVWVGSAAVAVGYDTNDYKIENDIYIFKTKSGKTKMVPKESLLSIDLN